MERRHYANLNISHQLLLVRDKNELYIEDPRLKGHIMTRIIVSAIKALVFVMGVVLASCFIGRGANARMRHVVSVQQRYVARRDRKINRW